MSLTVRRTLVSPLPWLGGLLLVYLAFPVVALLLRVADGPDRGSGATGLLPALGVSVEGATISLVLITVLGVPLAYLLARHEGRLASAVGVVVQLPLALPPLLSGILLVFVVGPYTRLGHIFGGRLTESLPGVVIAQSFVAAPFLVIAARSAFAAVDPALGGLAATLGHRPLARFCRVDLRGAAAGIRAGMVLTWLRAFGEYGATVIVAYHPFTLPIYTDNQFETAPLSTTEAPTLLAIAVAVAVVLLGRARLPRRRTGTALPAASPPGHSVPTAVGFALDATVGTFRLRLDHPAGASRLAIVGPSGSGKSVALRAIAGLLGPGAGVVTYNGADVTHVPPERRRIGYVPQGPGLIPGLTVRQQALFGVYADPARAAWWLSTLHLEDLLDRDPAQLSGGQRQRAGLARALAGDPVVVLLDEPFSALDAPVRAELRRELRRLQREAGLSTVVVTHDPEEAAYLADEILVIADGAVLQSGPVAEVFRRPASPAVARLLGIRNANTGVVVADGVMLTAGIRLDIGELPAVGAEVLWRISPEHVRIARIEGAGAATGAGRHTHPARVLDVVDLGLTVEVVLRLDDGPELRSRSDGRSELVAGQDCRVVLDPAHLTVWETP